MDSIREILRSFFIYVLYPAVVLGLFAYLIILLFYLVRCAKTASGAIRRAVGGLLPIIILVFLLSSGLHDEGKLQSWLDSLSDLHRFLLGAGAAFLMMETGKQLGRTDANSVVAAYAFFVSCVLAVLLYVVMGGFLDKLNWSLFAFILVGGLHVMFRGLPGWFDSPSS